jgi:predicted RNA-binding protein YlqC (UPF0109 family)
VSWVLASSTEFVERKWKTFCRLTDVGREVGMVIGKRGRNARELRTVLAAIAKKEKRQIELDIICGGFEAGCFDIADKPAVPVISRLITECRSKGFSISPRKSLKSGLNRKMRRIDLLALPSHQHGNLKAGKHANRVSASDHQRSSVSILSAASPQPARRRRRQNEAGDNFTYLSLG